MTNHQPLDEVSSSNFSVLRVNFGDFLKESGLKSAINRLILIQNHSQYKENVWTTIKIQLG
jgi:hypothetical protein